MRNVTILLAIVAMLAVTAQAALVDEDFSSDPGWTKSMGSGGSSDFGYDDTAHAITGTWDGEAITSRYYTDIGTTLTQADTFTFTFKVTPEVPEEPGTNDPDGYNQPVIDVGLMNAGSNNHTNALYIHLYRNPTGCRWKLYIMRHDSSGNNTGWNLLRNYDATPGTLNCELTYDGSGGVVAIAWTEGETKPSSGEDGYYSGSGFGGTWSVNALGTANNDVDSVYFGAVGATIDDMYLVPEPATMVLLGLGGIGVLLRRRKK